MYQFANVVKGKNNLRLTCAIGLSESNKLYGAELCFVHGVKNELVISVIPVKLISRIMGHPAVHR